MLPSAQLIIIELGCLDICNRNMRKFVVKYNQMECSCKRTSCFVNKMYYFGLLAFRLNETCLYLLRTQTAGADLGGARPGSFQPPFC